MEGDEWDARIWRCKRISIHTLRVEGDAQVAVGIYNHYDISIHTLRVEGDVASDRDGNLILKFQSTPSAWRVTFPLVFFHFVLPDFNPHPPRGG